jgi:DNA-binding transcriptional LysR family regulator
MPSRRTARDRNAIDDVLRLARGMTYKTALRGPGRRHGFQPNVRHHATDLLIVLALVRSGHAVALLPDLLGAHGDRGVVLRDVAGGPLARTILTAVRESSLDRPGLAQLRQALREAAL